jgi:hypothetical protein
MVGRSFPLTVYLHDEAWFEEQEKITTSSTETPEEISRRDIDPNSIRALIITDHLPTQMMLTPERLYLVRRVEKLVDQKAWKKCIRENSDRMDLFEFLNDDGRNTRLGLDLDDKGVLFLTEENLKQVLP